MTILLNGIGGTLGDTLATQGPLLTSGDVWYVDSVTGADTNDGRSRLEPLATLATAISSAASDDIIVLLAEHAETRTSALSITKRLTIVGEGAGTTQMPQLINNQDGQLVTISGSGTDVQFRNVYFPVETKANTNPRITSAVARTAFIGCYFEADANSDAAVVQINTGASDLLVKNCTFISTETTDGDPPEIALELAAAMSQVTIEGTVFSGGTQGWNDYAFKASAGAITRLRMEMCSFLLGADGNINTSSTGYHQVPTQTGAVRINGIG